MSRPILQSQFFKDHGPKREFYRRFENHYAWNQQILPIYEWEGLLFIASDLSDLLETPPREWPSHWILVEASTADLETLWTEFKDGFENSQSSSISLQTSTSSSLALPQIPDLNEPPDIPKFPNLPELPDIPDTLDNFDAALEIDEPSLHSAVATLKVPDFKTQKSPDAAKKSKEKTAEEELLGQFSETPSTSQKLTELEDLESLMNSDSGPVVDSDSDIFAEEKSGGDSDLLEGLSMNIAPIKLGRVESSEVPSVPVPEDLVAEGPVSEDTLPPMPRAAFLKATSVGAQAPPEKVLQEIDELTPTPPPIVPTPTEDVTVAPKGSKKDFSKFDIPHEERLLLDQLPKFYQRSFLALKAGNSIRLVSWPRDLSAEMASKEKDFSLNSPSPFRIVTRTEKPYHGYLVQTPFMNQIVGSWNSGQYPETLTVVPVKSEEVIVGFVLAFGTKEAEKKAGLQAVEKAAETISAHWKKIGSQFTQAA